MDKSKSNSAHLEMAIEYLNRCWSVVPAGERAKRLIIRWQPFQHQLPTAAQLDGWYERWPKANLAVVTAEFSRIVVVDVDPKHRVTGRS